MALEELELPHILQAEIGSNSNSYTHTHVFEDKELKHSTNNIL